MIECKRLNRSSNWSWKISTMYTMDDDDDDVDTYAFIYRIYNLIEHQYN